MFEELPAVLTPAEAAAALRCDPKTIYLAIRRGELYAARFSRRSLRIPRAALAEWFLNLGPEVKEDRRLARPAILGGDRAAGPRQPG